MKFTDAIQEAFVTGKDIHPTGGKGPVFFFTGTYLMDEFGDPVIVRREWMEMDWEILQRNE